MTDYAQKIAQELNLKPIHVSNAIALIDEGNTIPFIARYRKEATDSMDDQLLRQLGERLEYLRGLDKRKDEVSRSITEQGAMTEQLAAELEKAATLAEVEDLYRPYKPKRKTRASMAKAKGLEPLAQLILAQNAKTDPEAAARDYLPALTNLGYCYLSGTGVDRDPAKALECFRKGAEKGFPQRSGSVRSFSKNS